MLKRLKQCIAKPAANVTATRDRSSGKKVAATDRATPKPTSRIESSDPLQIQIWHIDRFVFYARNPRENDAAVGRMCASIREFGFKTPVLARSDGTLVDGHLRIKGARQLGITEIPTILCDEWTEQQVKAFRLTVNRSVTWADWDADLLALELQELAGSDFDLSLTGFDHQELDDLLLLPEDDDQDDTAPPLPDHPVSTPRSAISSSVGKNELRGSAASTAVWICVQEGRHDQ